MKNIKKVYCFVFSILLLFFYTNININADSVDITKTTVKADLSSMDKDDLSYLSNSENIFISMAQYYDLENNLRTYVYVNLANQYSHYKDVLYIYLSTANLNENFEVDESYDYYKLNYVNNDSNWYKFEIIGLNNLNITTRRYAIKEIVYLNNTNYSGINFSFEQIYVFNGISNNTINVFNQEIETITITDKEVGFFCYGDDLDFLFWDLNSELLAYGNVYSDVWYVFFNTDRNIDELLEIDITYKQYDYSICATNGTLKMQDAITEDKYNDLINNLPSGYQNDYFVDKFYINYLEQNVKTITPGIEKVSCLTSNWFGKQAFKYEIMDNILNLKEYKAKDSDKFIFTDYADNYSWGVKFLVTEKKVAEARDVGGIMTPLIIQGSGVKNTAILRLKYATDGIVKNCYAIDVPTNEFEGNTAEEIDDIDELLEKIKVIVTVILSLLPVILLISFFPAIFNFILVIFKYLINIILIPFKFIANLFNRKK